MSQTARGDADSLVVAALEAHRSGRFDEADALYKRALEADPDHVDALNLFGALAFEQGRVDESIRIIGRAVRLMPGHGQAWLNLAEAFETAGRAEEARDACQKALLAAPDFADAHARRARLLATAGKNELALSHARVAIALEPKSVEALFARGHALRAMNRLGEAETAFRSGLGIDPEHLRCIMGLASLLSDSERLDEAETFYRRAVDRRPNDALLLAALGDVIERGGDARAAVEIFDRAVSLNPRSAEIRFRRGCAFRDSGRFDLAQVEFREALVIRPDYALALQALVRMGALEDSPAARKHLARLAADGSNLPLYRVQAGFALGDLLDRAKEYDAAFGRFDEANALYVKSRRAAGEAFDRKELVDHVALIEGRLAAEFANGVRGWSVDTELPVFVVGLPRSGTTLVEQICAAHSKVVGAGELRAMQLAAQTIGSHNPGRDRIGDWDAQFARAEAERHAARLTGISAGAHRVVDKTPLNIMRLGFIAALFPKARIIRCRRDGRDVGVSNHTMYFGRGNLWSTDLSDCGFAIRQIEHLGDIWKATLDLPILEVCYEDLVADLEGHVRKIIDFLGLDWEEGCLRFYEMDRHVGTPSSWQVRQPIYSSSVGRWRRFESHLGPLIKALAGGD
jgi:tetratricopeptide (TPR) repeat protein